MARGRALRLCLLKLCESEIGLPKARAAPGVGKAVKLLEPPRLVILLPVDALSLVWKEFVFAPDVKNLPAPDCGLLNTLFGFLKPEEPPESPKEEEPW